MLFLLKKREYSYTTQQTFAANRLTHIRQFTTTHYINILSTFRNYFLDFKKIGRHMISFFPLLPTRSHLALNSLSTRSQLALTSLSTRSQLALNSLSTRSQLALYSDCTTK